MISLIIASGVVGFLGVIIFKTLTFPSKQVKPSSDVYDTSFISENTDRIVKNLQEVIRMNTTSRKRGDINYDEILQMHAFIQKGKII